MTEHLSTRHAAADGGSVMSVVRRTGLGLLGQMTMMSVFINVLTLAVPVFVLQVYDRVVPHAGFETLKGLFIGVVALIVFDFVLRQARGRMVQMIALRVDVALSKRLFARLVGAPLARLEGRTDVEWRTVLRDGDVVRDTVAGPMAVLVVDLPFVLLFIGVVALVAPPLAVVLLCLLPVYLAVAIAASAIVGRSSQSEQAATVEKGRIAEEIVAGRATVKALGLGDALRTRWEDAQAESIRRSILRGGDADSFNHVGTSLALLTTVLLTTVGAVAIVNQSMTIGGLIAANMLASRIVQPMMQLISLWRGYERFRESARRLDAVLAEPLERAESAVAGGRPEGRLALERVHFTYPGATAPALEEISLSLRPGVVTGVVGANGGGKSTLLKVMQGLYAPDEGRVLLDGADLAQFGRRELASWFGYVPQDPFLFAGSIRDNIARGRKDVDDARVLEAAKLADADGFVSDLPEGYGANVGEGGRHLSPGRRQRIAMARALVDDPAVLVLDEPSAHLDFQSECALIERIATLKAERTIVLVSHSRALLESCDNIVMMRAGRVVLAGPASEVLPHAASQAGRAHQSTPGQATPSHSTISQAAASS